VSNAPSTFNNNTESIKNVMDNLKAPIIPNHNKNSTSDLTYMPPIKKKKVITSDDNDNGREFSLRQEFLKSSTSDDQKHSSKMVITSTSTSTSTSASSTTLTSANDNLRKVLEDSIAYLVRTDKNSLFSTPVMLF
jgi:hypothetical protein